MQLDWDGTVTWQDAQVLLLNAFGRPDWAAVENEVYARGLGSRAAYPLIYEGFRVPAAEVAAFVQEHVHLDPGFPSLARFCRNHGIPLQIVSDGQRFYIERLLAAAGLDWVPVAANAAWFTAEGVRLSFVEPPGGCGRCGNCKRRWVDEFHRRGYRVLYAGDGRTDRCAARRADAVFARGSLLAFCQAEGLACHPLESLAQMERFLREEG
ncbi:MAG TPA: MtnX-like HAD-IB family phosphatase [Firmicutes bacterium]|nr:MtnX-like HAD-IB family phosphatase [Bacillota bacterium]